MSLTQNQVLEVEASMNGGEQTSHGGRAEKESIRVVWVKADGTLAHVQEALRFVRDMLYLLRT